MKEIVIRSSGRSLAARRFAPPPAVDPSGAGVLFIHGAGSDQSGYRERAESATRALSGICVTFDLGGHGASDGSAGDLSLADHLDDCIAAFDSLASSNGVDPQRIGICGASYGAYLASLMLARRATRSVLLRAPALYSDRDFRRPGGPQSSSVETPASAASLRAVLAYDGPVLILESEFEDVIPKGVAEAYLRACRDPTHEMIPQAGHVLAQPAWRAAFIDAIVRWFAATLTPRRRRAAPSAVA